MKNEREETRGKNNGNQEQRGHWDDHSIQKGSYAQSQTLHAAKRTWPSFTHGVRLLHHHFHPLGHSVASAAVVGLIPE